MKPRLKTQELCSKPKSSKMIYTASVCTSSQPLQFFPDDSSISGSFYPCTTHPPSLNPGADWPSRKVICHGGGGKAMQSFLKIMIIVRNILTRFFLQVFATLCMCTVFIQPICIKAPNPIGNIRVHGLMGSRPILGGANSLKMVPDARKWCPTLPKWRLLRFLSSLPPQHPGLQGYLTLSPSPKMFLEHCCNVSQIRHHVKQRNHV